MKKLISAVFFFSTLYAFAQRGVKESIKFDNPPVIDGKVDDWPGEWWLDPDGKFLSNVGNDADNLYFRLKISDDLTQEKIGLFGMSLKLNPTGKKKDKVGLKYPVGLDKNELKSQQKKEEANSGKETDVAARVQHKKELVSDVEVLELIGLAKQNIVSSRLGLANGIEVILVAQDDGSYIYEAKIPFKAFRLDKSKLENLGIEFESGRLIQQNKNATPNSGYGPSYGRPGSMGRQPQMYYNNYAYNPLSSPAYLSLTIKLN
ncbi:MAG: hypothetical protein OJF59_001276 [Cytophagales bacterium]|jgi:hypothetical protein|nr:hypothetical protein [Bacteroidota bacterium]MBS1981900.1 hypothetical protein [Bacteroidota bacterium]WHZ07523.1 MAG: hypothetical protein OJF59_001276 [Cytophagales bacterium]